MEIEKLNLSTRTYNCLKRRGINTVEKLMLVQDKDLLRIRSFGRECLKEVHEKLAEHKNFQKNPIRESLAISVAESMSIVNEKEKQTVNLPEALIRAVEILQEEYEKTRNNTFIHNPVAWALYHTWRRIESGRD